MNIWNPARRKAAVGALSALYLLQAFSPLRLDNDSVVYLRMGARLADGIPIDTPGLPLGYPFFISILDRIGFGNAFAFVIANCLFAGAGLWALSYLFDRRADGQRSLVVPLTMLSVLLIRYLPVHLPETMYFGISLTAVATMTAANDAHGRRRATLLVAAGILAGLAIGVRMVGVALIPALGLSIALVARKPYKDDAPQPSRLSIAKILAAAGGLIMLFVLRLALAASFSKYSTDLTPRVSHGQWEHRAATHFRGLAEILGSIALNLPISRIDALRPLLFWIGVAVALLALAAMRVRMPRTPASIYLATFVIILVVWPFEAERLWFPVVPLVIGFADAVVRRLTVSKGWMRAVRVYVAYFCITGIAALAYTTRITFSGKNFSKVYGVAGGMATPDAQTGKVDERHNRRARELMRRYANPF